MDSLVPTLCVGTPAGRSASSIETQSVSVFIPTQSVGTRNEKS